MSIYNLTLNPKQCAALLLSIVDCEPSLYEQIETCAKEYTDNPTQYEQDEEMLELFYKHIVDSSQCEIGQIEHKGDIVTISWYHIYSGTNYKHEYYVKTKTFSKW